MNDAEEEIKQCYQCGERGLARNFFLVKSLQAGRSLDYCANCRLGLSPAKRYSGEDDNQSIKFYLNGKEFINEKDPVNHPSHYNTGKIEVIEFIEDQKFSYHRGNAIKYLARAGRKDKDKTTQDLEKAMWYIAREIELLSDETPCRPNEMTK